MSKTSSRVNADVEVFVLLPVVELICEAPAAGQVFAGFDRVDNAVAGQLLKQELCYAHHRGFLLTLDQLLDVILIYRLSRGAVGHPDVKFLI